MSGTIDILLTYYDKAYTKSMDRRKERIGLSVAWNGLDVNQYASELMSHNPK